MILPFIATISRRRDFQRMGEMTLNRFCTTVQILKDSASLLISINYRLQEGAIVPFFIICNFVLYNVHIQIKEILWGSTDPQLIPILCQFQKIDRLCLVVDYNEISNPGRHRNVISHHSYFVLFDFYFWKSKGGSWRGSNEPQPGPILCRSPNYW